VVKEMSAWVLKDVHGLCSRMCMGCAQGCDVFKDVMCGQGCAWVLKDVMCGQGCAWVLKDVMCGQGCDVFKEMSAWVLKDVHKFVQGCDGLCSRMCISLFKEMSEYLGRGWW
jgi:hypothetical protein